MRRCSIESRIKKYVKGHGCLSFARKYRKQLSDTGLDSLNSTSKKVVHEPGEFLGNKTEDAVANSYDGQIVKTKLVEEIIIPPEKRE